MEPPEEPPVGGEGEGPAADAGVFSISVVAQMVSMQIQNLRVYERRGLLRPSRTSGGTRLYSAADVARLHRVRRLLAEGLNLAGVLRVMDLEDELSRERGHPGAQAGEPGEHSDRG